MNKEALFYRKINEEIVKCELCPHYCNIKKDDLGLCGIRRNIEGCLASENYSQCAFCSIDPIEKKPLYHFYPGSQILSIGSIGCNFVCSFCQNWRISQDIFANSKIIFPEQIIKMAEEHDVIGVAYTYNEPSVWYEYVLDTAKIVKNAGYKNVLVSNGYINKEPLKQILPYIDGLNIDIKSMDEDFYKQYCDGSLQPVLDTACLAKKNSHVEITNLVIPTLNDKDENFQKLGKWICENLGKDTPLHISRYFPQYKLKIEHTPFETLKKAKEILSEYLSFVYVGNVSDFDNNTYCLSCKNILVQRKEYSVLNINCKKNTCLTCQTKVNLIN